MQLLIDTIFRDLDLPKFYLWDLGDGNFECVDGQQRFRAIFGFFDGVFPISETEPSEYPGAYFDELLPEVQKKINDYQIDVVKLEDASELDVARMFDRLQRGVTTNAAEKLNAILGGMRDFVKALTSHPFFEKISVPKGRMAHNQIAAQATLISLEGPHNLKFPDLEKMYKKFSSFDSRQPEAVKVREGLDFLNQIFPTRTTDIRNRATVISFFWLVSSQRKELEGKEREVREFLKEFQDELRKQVELGREATDAELLSYQAAVIQAADSRESIIRRHDILIKRLREYMIKERKR
jgi:hypothetical protein